VTIRWYAMFWALSAVPDGDFGFGINVAFVVVGLAQKWLG
jgi:hypothetical protein